MGLLKVQRLALIGMLLGDGYLQPVGRRSARLRVEHSIKQKDYIFWKYEIFKNYMQSRPKVIKRYNPRWKKWYLYLRCQSHSSPIFGKYRRIFYQDSQKRIPNNIKTLLKHPLSLAVWIMDDGYLYKRDNHLFIYLPPYREEEITLLMQALEENYNVEVKYRKKKQGKERYFYFDKKNTKKILKIIEPHLIPSVKSKFLLAP
jgi:hypothetical protein